MIDLLWAVIRFGLGILFVFCLILYLGLTLWASVAPRYTMAKKGYLVETWFGREAGDECYVAYRESDRSLEFFGKRDDRIIKVPSERLWNEIMPNWAKNRRTEILQRIQDDVVKLKFNFVEYDDKKEGAAIMATDPSIEEGKKLFYVAKSGE